MIRLDVTATAGHPQGADSKSRVRFASDRAHDESIPPIPVLT
jgi:hypothetical protein